MYCSKCGKEAKGKDKFCGGCGQSLGEGQGKFQVDISPIRNRLFNKYKVAMELLQEKKVKRAVLIAAAALVFFIGIRVLDPFSSSDNKGQHVVTDSPAEDASENVLMEEIFDLVLEGNIQDIEAFLGRESNFNLNITNDDGITPLMIAAINDDFAIIDLLLSYGALIDFRGEGFGETALSYAVLMEGYSSAELLLKRGAYVNNQDGKGNTPLMYAIENSNSEMVQLLLNYGIDTMKENNEGLTAIDSLVLFGNTDIQLDILESISRIVGKWEGILTSEETFYGFKTEYDITPGDLSWYILTNGQILGATNDGTSFDSSYSFDGKTLVITEGRETVENDIRIVDDLMFVTTTDGMGNKYTLTFVRKAPVGVFLQQEEKVEVDESYDLFDLMGKSIRHVEDVTGRSSEVLMIENSEALTEDDEFIPITVVRDGLYEFNFFLGEEVHTIFLHEGAQVLDVSVGMGIDEIKGVLGKPHFEGYSPEWDDVYELVYRIGDFELGLYSEDRNSPTVSGYIK